MASTSSATPIAVYGATGFTGRLVADELGRRGVPMVLAGRNPDRLASTAELVDGDIVRSAAVSLDDAGGLRKAFAGCGAVINAAGPFARLGEPVIRAAIAAECHYCDTTGEQDWMRRVFEAFDEPARRRGVAAVPAVGFDSVPGDLLASLVAADLKPLRELMLACDVEHFGMTRGTLRASLDQMRGGDVAYRDGRYVPAPRGPLRTYVTFPDPVGRQRVAKHPSGEQVTVPRHVRTRSVTCLLSTRTVAPGPVARLLPALAPGIGRLLRTTPLHERLDAAIEGLPEGPSAAARRRVTWTVACFARDEDGHEATGLVRGPDVYGFTAVAAVAAARRLVDPGYDRAGALAPAAAFDARSLLEELVPFGVSYEVGRAGATVGAP